MGKRVVCINTTRTGYGIDQVIGDTITVGQFIEILQGYDEDSKVIFKNDRGYTYGYIDEDLLEEETIEEEKEDDGCLTREDMELEIEAEVNGSEKKDINTSEFIKIIVDGQPFPVISVGYDEVSGKVGCFTGDFCFIPLDALSDDDINDVWYDICR